MIFRPFAIVLLTFGLLLSGCGSSIDSKAKPKASASSSPSSAARPSGAEDAPTPTVNPPSTKGSPKGDAKAGKTDTAPPKLKPTQAEKGFIAGWESMAMSSGKGQFQESQKGCLIRKLRRGYADLLSGENSPQRQLKRTRQLFKSCAVMWPGP